MTIALQTSGLRPHQIELLKRTIAADCTRNSHPRKRNKSSPGCRKKPLKSITLM